MLFKTLHYSNWKFQFGHRRFQHNPRRFQFYRWGPQRPIWHVQLWNGYGKQVRSYA